MRARTGRRWRRFAAAPAPTPQKRSTGDAVTAARRRSRRRRSDFCNHRFQCVKSNWSLLHVGRRIFRARKPWTRKIRNRPIL